VLGFSPHAAAAAAAVAAEVLPVLQMQQCMPFFTFVLCHLAASDSTAYHLP
jgi:hypothetical protein